MQIPPEWLAKLRRMARADLEAVAESVAETAVLQAKANADLRNVIVTIGEHIRAGRPDLAADLADQVIARLADVGREEAIAAGGEDPGAAMVDLLHVAAIGRA